MRTTSAATAAALLAAMWIPTAWAQALAPAGQGEATALVPTGPAHPVPPLDAAAAQKLGAPRGAAPTFGAD